MLLDSALPQQALRTVQLGLPVLLFALLLSAFLPLSARARDEQDDSLPGVVRSIPLLALPANLMLTDRPIRILDYRCPSFWQCSVQGRGSSLPCWVFLAQPTSSRLSSSSSSNMATHPPSQSGQLGESFDRVFVCTSLTDGLLVSTGRAWSSGPPPPLSCTRRERGSLQRVPAGVRLCSGLVCSERLSWALSGSTSLVRPTRAFFLSNRR